MSSKCQEVAGGKKQCLSGYNTDSRVDVKGVCVVPRAATLENLSIAALPSKNIFPSLFFRTNTECSYNVIAFTWGIYTHIPR